MCPHEKCITCEKNIVVLIFLVVFMNVKIRECFLFILLIFESQAFQHSIVNLKVFHVS